MIPPPAPPAPPVISVQPPPEKVWTAEELTLPIVHFSCDMMTADRRLGKLEFSSRGGRAYREAREDKQLVRGLARTKQGVAFEIDDLGLFRGPVVEDAKLSTGDGQFFVRLTDPNLPPVPYASKIWRRVSIKWNYGMGHQVTVYAVPASQLAVGFCSMRAESQAPLSPEETSRELGQ